MLQARASAQCPGSRARAVARRRAVSRIPGSHAEAARQARRSHPSPADQRDVQPQRHRQQPLLLPPGRRVAAEGTERARHGGRFVCGKLIVCESHQYVGK